MYFPYLRGRQYEMLALKELVQKGLINNLVFPIVEPIKITSTFNSAVKVFVDAGLNIALIDNPAIGPLNRNILTNALHFYHESIVPAIIMQDNSTEVVDSLVRIGKKPEELMVVLNNRDYLESYKELFGSVSPQYTLFPEERSIRRAVSFGKVMLDDKFVRQEKNSDYFKNPDEFFSDDHLFYKDEGFSGFGDYSIIGNYYDEGGFAPKAVAIHIVYFDKDKTLRVHHFVSDSNDGIEDPAGKFYEAVTKLYNWYNSFDFSAQKTYALGVLLDYQERGYYPALPTIKKLSIMHHLELMNKFLNGEFNS